MTELGTTLLLAIAPSSRGFGYTLFLGPKKLLDWGVKEIRVDKNARCVTQAAVLIGRMRRVFSSSKIGSMQAVAVRRA
jgi:hypothetical protein